MGTLNDLHRVARLESQLRAARDEIEDLKQQASIAALLSLRSENRWLYRLLHIQHTRHLRRLAS